MVDINHYSNGKFIDIFIGKLFVNTEIMTGIYKIMSINFVNVYFIISFML